VELIGSRDQRYDEARAVFNAMIDRRPALIARCATPLDVVHALDLANREDYQVAVRAGGHSVAGMSVNDGGIVIDVKPMKTITIDPAARRAKVGAGVTWGEFDRAAQRYGLATTGGRVSSTGVAGFTLGGGSGWAERKFGLACDNLISVDLVTADGAGDPAEGQDAIKPFADLHPQADLVAPMAYADFQRMIDDPPGLRHYWSADFHDEFSDEALDVFVTYAAGRKSPLTQQILFPWGGAVARADDGSTPLTHRSAHWITHPFAIWEDPADNEANIAWARGFRRDIARFTTGGTYLNFIGDEGQDRVRAAFGDENYARLAAVKAKYDPDNVFRGNQNIKPAA
jgi:FAD/FMN-containing dehydrogenase